MTTTSESLKQQYKDDPDGLMKRLEEAYKDASWLQQAQLRLISAIGLIMNSNVSVDIKSDALGHAITAYTHDTNIDTCEMLAKGILEGLDVNVGLAALSVRSATRAKKHNEILVNILETLTYDDAKPAA